MTEVKFSVFNFVSFLRRELLKLSFSCIIFCLVANFSRREFFPEKNNFFFWGFVKFFRPSLLDERKLVLGGKLYKSWYYCHDEKSFSRLLIVIVKDTRLLSSPKQNIPAACRRSNYSWRCRRKISQKENSLTLLGKPFLIQMKIFSFLRPPRNVPIGKSRAFHFPLIWMFHLHHKKRRRLDMLLLLMLCLRAEDNSSRMLFFLIAWLSECECESDIFISANETQTMQHPNKRVEYSNEINNVLGEAK